MILHPKIGTTEHLFLLDFGYRPVNPQPTYKADESRNTSDIYCLANCLKAIDEACKRGEYITTVYSHLSNGVKVRLIKLGYAVIVHWDNTSPDPSFIISWS